MLVQCAQVQRHGEQGEGQYACVAEAGHRYPAGEAQGQQNARAAIERYGDQGQDDRIHGWPTRGNGTCRAVMKVNGVTADCTSLNAGEVL